MLCIDMICSSMPVSRVRINLESMGELMMSAASPYRVIMRTRDSTTCKYNGLVFQQVDSKKLFNC